MNAIQNDTLEKYRTGLVMEIEGLFKTVHKDDFEIGESTNYALHDIDINESYDLTGTETKEKLTELILEAIERTLYFTGLKKSDFMINDDRITLSVMEDEDTCHLTSEEVKRHFKESKDVFSCYYDMRVSLNGLTVDNEDLIKLFDFEY